MSDMERILVVFDCATVAFDDPDEWRRVLRTVEGKIVAQLARKPALCGHPEASDQLRDVNGVIVGSVLVRRHGRWGCP